MEHLQENPRRWSNPSLWTMNDLCAFAVFALFYLSSFAWDACLIRGGYVALAMVQQARCLEDNTFGAATGEAAVISLIFLACIHGVLLIWIFGFLHSSKVSEDCLFGLQTALPTSWCHPSLCLPWTGWYLLSVAMCVLSFALFLFTMDIYSDAETAQQLSNRYRVCGGETLVESANFWLLMSLIVCAFLIMFQCLYCALIRVITGDVSLILPGQQRVYAYDENRQPVDRQRRIEQEMEQQMQEQMRAQSQSQSQSEEDDEDEQDEDADIGNANDNNNNNNNYDDENEDDDDDEEAY